MKRSDLSTRYVLFVVDYAGVNAWDHLSAAVPPKVALAAIQREVDAGNLDYGVWLGRPFLTPEGRAKLAELSRPRERQSPDRHTADPGYKNAASLPDEGAQPLANLAASEPEYFVPRTTDPTQTRPVLDRASAWYARHPDAPPTATEEKP